MTKGFLVVFLSFYLLPSFFLSLCFYFFFLFGFSNPISSPFSYEVRKGTPEEWTHVRKLFFSSFSFFFSFIFFEREERKKEKGREKELKRERTEEGKEKKEKSKEMRIIFMERENRKN